ncbi:MAG: hypothetical protein U1A07_08580 [Phenylobacterium sp.]|nr:hypothetical protein [Phenylobacterium sp.]
MFGFFKKVAQRRDECEDSQPLDPIEAFWTWIVENRSGIVAEVQSFQTGGAGSDLSISQLGDRLGRIDPGLVHEVGMADPDTLDVVISAEGITGLFPKVLEVVNRAPTISGLKATPFRQRAPGSSLEVVGQKMTADDVSYVSFREGKRIGLDVFFDVDLDEHARGMVGFLMLDMTLGEYDVGTALGSIEFRKGRAPVGAKRLTELSHEVDAVRPGTPH